MVHEFCFELMHGLKKFLLQGVARPHQLILEKAVGALVVVGCTRLRREGGARGHAHVYVELMQVIKEAVFRLLLQGVAQ